MKNKKFTREIVVFLVMFLCVSSIIIPKELNNLDELWNFNFAKNISDGKLPYKDFNMVQTPLLPIICGLILKFTAKELIIMRIISSLVNTCILFTTYKILKELKLNKYYIYTALIAIYTLIYNYLTLDYNFAVLLIALLVIYVEIKNLNKKQTLLNPNFKYNFFLGILIGTSILFKQTTGLALSGVFVVYKFLLYKKDELKLIFKIIVQRALGVSLPIIAFIVYLLANNILNDFLNYAVYGIKTFTTPIPYYYLIKYYEIPVKVLSIVLPLMMIFIYFKNIVKKQKTLEDSNILILFVYSVASFIVVFPISDSIHFLIGATPMIILMFYAIYDFGKNRFKDKKEFIFEYLKKRFKNGNSTYFIVSSNYFYKLCNIFY